MNGMKPCHIQWHEAMPYPMAWSHAISNTNFKFHQPVELTYWMTAFIDRENKIELKRGYNAMKIKVNIYRMGYNGISSNSCDIVMIIIIKTTSTGPLGKPKLFINCFHKKIKKEKKSSFKWSTFSFTMCTYL